MTPGWGWRRARGAERRNWCLRGLVPLVTAAPWLTVGLMLLMLHFIGGTLTAAEGVLFDLPDSGLTDGRRTDLVALALSMPHETLVFFDDARYVLGDGVSLATFGSCLAERVRASGETTLLVLVDRKVSSGDLMKLAGVCRQNGVKRVLFANRSSEERAE